VKGKILVIDDEPGVLELVKYNLEEAGFGVETSTDGADGLKKARETVPDLVLLDILY